ncbi:MAG TPA: class I SAM-dependent methyltransferase [Chryseolinea sp.]|nr:class I SAM-dependent methyltransferase [Chryseolinea sp.]
MSHVTECPICAGTVFNKFLTIQDYSVTRETFDIIRCTSCQFLITSPIPADLDRYYQSSSYVSHATKPKSLIDKIYHLVRRFTLRWKVNLIKKRTTAHPLRVLDYGCGTGDFLTACQAQGWEIAGVEPSAAARAVAAERTRSTIASDLKQLKSDNFHVITLWHVLEHVSDLNGILQQLKDKLTPTGIIFIAVPNHNSNDAKHYQQTWAAYDVPRHLWHFSQDTMHLLLAKHQLKLVSTVPMKLDSFYVSMLSEKYLHGQPSPITMARGLLQGMQSNIKARKKYEYSSLIYIVRK